MFLHSNTAALRNCAVAAALVAAPIASAVAATPASTASASSIFGTSIADPTRDVRYQPAGVSSSDDAVTAGDPGLSVSAERDSLSGDAAQPGPGRRRTYGRSRYQDRLHNADGSTKIAFMAGAGLNMPVGDAGKFYTPSYTVSAGAGLNFNRTFGILGEFHYDHMGVTSGAINTEYNNLLTALQPLGYGAGDLAGFDANAHVLSLTVDPVVNFADRRSKVGAYITGGVGWYRKTTNFTLPTAQTGCSYYYCTTFYSTYNFDSATADTFGYNAGFGLTYKLSEFSSERLFVDARYNYAPLSSNNSTDFFPYNRRDTSFIPITFGIRF